jgi:hypothetical protein
MRSRPSDTMLYFPSVGYGGRVAVGEQGKEDLASICDVLNSSQHRELRGRLRKLMTEWRSSGPNLQRMMAERENRPLFKAMSAALCVKWTPTNDGRAQFIVVSNYESLAKEFGDDRISQNGPSGEWEPTPEAESWVLFSLFLLNPECDQLAGPCGRCDRYYVKKRSSQKIYCSRRCGNAATAVARTSQRLKTEHKDKMQRASLAIREWNALKTRPAVDWKAWLHKRLPDVSSKFVTRWVNKGKLPRPKDDAQTKIRNKQIGRG